MSLENRIEELNTTIKSLIELLQSQQQPPETKAPKAKKAKVADTTPELPVESFIEEAQKKVIEISQPSIEPTSKVIAKADILEVAKVKLTEGKTTKEEIKAIITGQGYDSLNDITNQDDFKTILSKIEAL